MHDPVGLLPSGGSPFVEHQCLLHPDELRGLAVEDLSVFSGGLPVAGAGCSVGSDSGRVLSVPQTEEIPLFFSHLRLT